MSSVNDLMAYLNTKFGLSLPVLPLSRFTQALTAIWNSAVSGWPPGKTPPPTVEVTITPGTTIPLGTGAFAVTSCTVELTGTPQTPPRNARSKGS